MCRYLTAVLELQHYQVFNEHMIVHSAYKMSKVRQVADMLHRREMQSNRFRSNDNLGGWSQSTVKIKCQPLITFFVTHYIYQCYRHCAFPLMGRIEEERAEDWHVDAVGQDGQVRLGKLESCALLLNKLPYTLEEEQEDRRLTLPKTEVRENPKSLTFNAGGNNELKLLAE